MQAKPIFSIHFTWSPTVARVGWKGVDCGHCDANGLQYVLLSFGIKTVQLNLIRPQLSSYRSVVPHKMDTVCT